jgi:dTMP kinase
MSVFAIIDGGDGSGKKTQTYKAKEELEKRGYSVKIFDFPQYEKPSCAIVKNYLSGKFGNPEEAGPYKGSIGFSVDRFFVKDELYDAIKNYDVVLTNRFVSANMIHQGGKIKDITERENFLKWIENLEYKALGLPKPDLTIYLKVSPETSMNLVEKRGEKKDIHENLEHLTDSYNAAQYLAETRNWITIECEQNNSLRTINDIAQEVQEYIFNRLPKK